jgi:hypothetical protein
LWQHTAQREAWRQRLSASAVAAGDLEGLDGADAEAAAAAIPLLDDASFTALRRGVATAALPAPLSFAIAQRAPDRDSYDRVLASGTERQRLALIASASTALPSKVAVDWLRRASEQPALASAAVLAIAELAAQQPDAQALLLQALDDPELAPSAAAGLARGPLAGRVERIAALRDADASAIKRRHLELALKLEGSPAAAALLQAWSRLPERDAMPELQP